MNTRMACANTVSIRLDDDDLSKLDALRPAGSSRSAFVRRLIREAGPAEQLPSRLDALRLLAESARAGRVQAQVALERALRATEREDAIDDELERLLAGD